MKSILTLIIIILCSNFIYGQSQFNNGGNNYFQEIVINNGEEDVCFMRESKDSVHWYAWMKKPPRDSDTQTFKPKYYANSNIERIVGKEVIEWLNNRPRISGYYNFTDNPKYDWEKFGGENYGTYNTEKLNIKIYPPKE